MPLGLVRLQESGQSHFVTLSCYRRLPNFRPRHLRDLFLESLERMRVVYRFRVYAYVVMPEHVHLLVSEPETSLLATALQALKISVARQAKDPHLLKDPHLPTAGRYGAPSVWPTGPFWQKRY